MSKGGTLFFPAVNTEDCENAVRWAWQHVYKSGDVAHFFHVVPHAQAAYSGVFLPPSSEEVDQKAKIAEDALRERLTPICETAGVPYELEVVKTGGDAESIGEVICARAVEVGARIVILCAHDKGKAVRFFVGSVTDYCVRHSSVPVVVVHQHSANSKRNRREGLLGALAEAEG